VTIRQQLRRVGKLTSQGKPRRESLPALRGTAD
jgi:hypothetical protein